MACRRAKLRHGHGISAEVATQNGEACRRPVRFHPFWIALLMLSIEMNPNGPMPRTKGFNPRGEGDIGAHVADRDDAGALLGEVALFLLGRAARRTSSQTSSTSGSPHQFSGM